MGLRLGIDMGLFDVAAAATNKNDHVTIEQLASGTGADIQLVSKCEVRQGSLREY